MNSFIPVFIVVCIAMIYACSVQCMRNRTPRFVVYGSMQCGFTVKMLDYLNGAGESVRFVDVDTHTGNAEFKRITKGKNIRGVPYTVDRTTNTSIRGFQEIIL